MNKEVAEIVVLVVTFLFVLTAYPLGLIWAVNTLFGLTIAYTVKNWFAMFLLGVLFGSRSRKKKED